MAVAAAAASELESGGDDAGSSVFCQDIAHLLRRYAAGVGDLLDDASRPSALAEPRPSGRSAAPGPVSPGRSGKSKESQELKLREEALRATAGCDRYRQLLLKEQDRWIRGREELAEVQIEARRLELDAVHRHFAEPAANRFHEAVQERCAMYLQQMQPSVSDGRDSIAEAKQQWSAEICQRAMQDVRQEWRAAQKRLLGSLVREMRHERQTAVDALDRQAQSWERLASASKAGWDAEVAKAKEQLDRLADGYRKAMQVLLETELREARRFVTDQAEFFKSEIQEAARAEKAEQARMAAQIRGMHISVLKWRQDYMADADRKAEEVAQQMRFRRLGVSSPWDEDQDARDHTGETVTDEIVQEARHLAERALAKLPEAQQAEAAPGVMKAMVRRLKGKVAAERLVRCKDLMHKMQQAVTVKREENHNFLLRLEAAVPASSEILRIYEEHLAEHGVLAALSAVARPPPGEEEEEFMSPVTSGGRGLPAAAAGAAPGMGRAQRGPAAQRAGRVGKTASSAR